MSVLSINKLNKRYEKFHLKDVSFELDKGYIMGFIGANGAGKTTTLKSMLNLVQKDSGTVTMFGKDYHQNETSLKSDIGFMFGEANYYRRKKVKAIIDVAKRFYPNWDDNTYAHYMKRFGLDEDKKVDELSAGMKVKFSLVLALSHNARLLILDEPTSGLDPVARDDILELFQELIEAGEISILFSTHITSDLEKCADYITYINDGEIIASSTKDDFINTYRLIKGTKAQLEEIKESLISYKLNTLGFTGLIEQKRLPASHNFETELPMLDEIMIYYAKEGNNNV